MAAATVPLRPAHTSETFVRRFLECKGQLSPRTLDAYGTDLADFSAWLNGEITATEDGDVHRYLAHCLERNLAPGTINRRISVLREFFKQLQRDSIIKHDPMRRISLLKGSAFPRQSR